MKLLKVHTLTDGNTRKITVQIKKKILSISTTSNSSVK